MIIDMTVTLGERMPLSTRRVLRFCGMSTSKETELGIVEGMADGAVVVRDPILRRHYELTPAQAVDVANALLRASHAVEQWQEHASGFNKIRVYRSTTGHVEVMFRGRRRPMRLAKLKGHKSRDGCSRRFWRRCDACAATPPALYVAADVVREHGQLVHHVEICPACVDKLANAPEPRAELVQFKPHGT